MLLMCTTDKGSSKGCQKPAAQADIKPPIIIEQQFVHESCGKQLGLEGLEQLTKLLRRHLPLNIDSCSTVCYAALMSLEQLPIHSHGLAIYDDGIAIFCTDWTCEQRPILNVNCGYESLHDSPAEQRDKQVATDMQQFSYET